MPALQKFKDTDPYILWAIGLFLIPIISIFSQKSVVGTLPIAAVITFIFAIWQKRINFSLPKKPIYILIILFIAYGAATSLWSISPERALKSAATLAGLFLVLVGFNQLALNATQRQRNYVGYGLLGGLGVGVLFFLAEKYMNYPVYAFFNGDNHGKLDEQLQNRPMMIITLLYIVAFPLYIKNILRILFGSIIFVLLCWMTFTSRNYTAMVMVLPIIPFILFICFTPVKISYYLVKISLFATILTAPFISMIFMQNVPQVMQWDIPDSFKNRVEIWDQSARRTMEKPLLGWGLDNATHIPNRGEVSKLNDDLLLAHHHPHNGPIQIWYELGLIGVLIMSVIYWLLFGYIKKNLNPWQQKYVLSVICFGFVSTLFSYGQWQSWLIALFVCVFTTTNIIMKKQIKYDIF
jgi:O-antigen ligase